MDGRMIFVIGRFLPNNGHETNGHETNNIIVLII